MIIKNPKVKSSGNSHSKKSPVIYIGQLPHGFFEPQVQKFFSQFGKIKRLKLSRNKVTGRCRHYGFIEYQFPEVAKIVAETMNNYLFFDKLMKCNVVAPENIKDNMFNGWTVENGPYSKTIRDKFNAPKTLTALKKCTEKREKRIRKVMKSIKALGIDYDPEIEAMEIDDDDEVEDQKMVSDEEIPAPDMNEAEAKEKAETVSKSLLEDKKQSSFIADIKSDNNGSTRKEAQISDKDASSPVPTPKSVKSRGLKRKATDLSVDKAGKVFIREVEAATSLSKKTDRIVDKIETTKDSKSNKNSKKLEKKKDTSIPEIVETIVTSEPTPPTKKLRKKKEAPITEVEEPIVVPEPTPPTKKLRKNKKVETVSASEPTPPTNKLRKKKENPLPKIATPPTKKLRKNKEAPIPEVEPVAAPEPTPPTNKLRKRVNNKADLTLTSASSKKEVAAVNNKKAKPAVEKKTISKLTRKTQKK